YRMRAMMDQVLSEIESRREESVKLLKDFLRMASVSTRPENSRDVNECASWVAEQLGAAGLDARVLATAGHPAVLAKNQHRADRPTVLFYGHYDVQPAEPLELWTTPPFEPTVRGG